MDHSRHDEDADKAATSSGAESGKSGKKKAKFEPPKVITYSGDDILDELGPAHACNPFSGSVVAC